MPDFGRWTANGGDPSLNDINRADKFLDALAAEQPVFSTDRGDADLAFLLSGWRDEVRQVPMDHVVTPAEAGAALVDATAAPSRRNRFGLAVVGSAAAAVLCLGGFGTAVFAAGPGDGLYPIRSMFFGDERATRDDAVVLAAQTELAQVQQLVDQGQWDQAQDKLAALSATVQSVDQVDFNAPSLVDGMRGVFYQSTGGIKEYIGLGGNTYQVGQTETSLQNYSSTTTT